MQHHPYFDLWLHEDAELSALLGSLVVERTTLHEWPLSCVQRLRLADGRTRIYKTQAAPTVEPAFYAAAQSPLLVAARILTAAEGPAALLLDDLSAPRLVDLRPSEAGARRVGATILEQIVRIAGAPPTFVDIHIEELWMVYAGALLADLNALIEKGMFHLVDRALVGRLAQLVESPSVLAAIRSPIGYVHGDLNGDNIFVMLDGYRVIDWQRPVYGPVALNLANVLDSLGFDARRHVDVGVVQLLYILRIAWFAQCARRWFQPGAPTYDAAIARLVNGVVCL